MYVKPHYKLNSVKQRPNLLFLKVNYRSIRCTNNKETQLLTSYNYTSHPVGSCYRVYIILLPSYNYISHPAGSSYRVYIIL